MNIEQPQILHIAQGEFAVSRQPGVVITTVLGSCVAACIWDPDAGTGGMNHILLPDGGTADLRSASIGANAMELLINGLIREGATRGNLQAKLFGGASMIRGLSSIGERNSRFALDYLHRECIPCASQSLGGSRGRRVKFWPTTGRAQQLQLVDRWMPDETVKPAPNNVTGGATGIELF